MKTLFQICVPLLVGVFIAYLFSTPLSYGSEELEFNNRNTTLSGTIVFPDEELIEAAVVFVHGSGPARRNLSLAKKFASEGIAAFVYDKRGVGKSGGEFEQRRNVSEENLELLAGDAAAALAALSQHPRLNGVPAGFTGLSQAGWIVPLAAEKSPDARFIGLWSGPVGKVSDEDIFSSYTSDRDMKNIPPFYLIKSMREEPYIWPESLGKDTDSAESLARLNIPGFWIFGEDDGSIPVDLSISNLKQLKEEGRNLYEYVVFSDMGHGTIDRTFTTMTDWIKRTVTTDNTVENIPILTSEDLDPYVGIYESRDPVVRVEITKRGTKLFGEAEGETVDLKFTGGHSFIGHDLGYGYVFVEFDPQSRQMTVTEHGDILTFVKQ